MNTLKAPSQNLQAKSVDEFCQITSSDAALLKSFESAFYRAFISIEDNILIRKIWDWDDTNRKIKLRMNYDNLIILCWKSSKDRIKCGVAANLNTNSAQLTQFGFSFPLDASKPHCEIVTLFSDCRDREFIIGLNRHFLKGYCIPFMSNLGYKSLYSTCAEKPLRTYMRWGWSIIDETILEGENRYLLQYDIEKNLYVN